MKTKRILVTGGAGYIGSHMLLALESSAFDVIVVDDLSTGLKSNLIHGTFVHGDISQKAFVDALFEQYAFDVVIHFAAKTSVPESMQKPEWYFQHNTAATLNLIQACIQTQVRNFIFSSTAAVYGNHASGIVDEEATTQPMNPYGDSKLLAETIIRDCCKVHPMNYVILRYFNVAGVDPSLRVGPSPAKADHLLKAVVKTSLGRQSALDIYGDDYPTIDGTGVRDYIHVKDLIDAHRLALEHMLLTPIQATFNCGYGHGYSVKQVVAAANQLFKQNLPVKVSARRPGDCPMMITNPEKLQQRFNWQPKFNNLDLMLTSLKRWEEVSTKQSAESPADSIQY